MIRIPRLGPTIVASLFVLPVFQIAGCAPASFQDNISWTVDRYHTANARSRLVNEMPFLRLDDSLLDRLKRIDDVADPADADRQLRDILDASHALAVSSAGEEIDHLPEAAIDNLWRRHFQNPPSGDRRSEIRSRYLQQLDSEYAAYCATLPNAPTSNSVHQVAQSIAERAGPSVKDQRGGGLLLKEIARQYDRPADAANSLRGSFVRYSPAPMTADELAADGLTSEDAAALIRYAPVLLQERRDSAKYAARDDEIGKVQLDGVPGQIQVELDTSAPMLYAYAQTAVIHDREHAQLVYCWWFPEHPAMTPGDPEAGHVDGATIRITLDTQSRPAIVETIQNCGCHIRCFASAALDAEASRVQSTTSESPASALEKPKRETPRLDVTDTFDLSQSDNPATLVIVSRAGFHDVVAISGESNTPGETRQILASRTYRLAPYDILENLPTRFGRASMFGPDGLVHNAGRLEGWLLAPTGMRSAGQPRQRGTQLICWDALNFDDPHLLEKTLRLPDDF